MNRIALLAALLLALPAYAIDPALCNDDGVTEVPPFAEGRDGNGCLRVDPGNGDPEILFQYEEYNKVGIADWSGTCQPGTVKIRELDASDHGKCSTRSDTPLADNQCTYIAWNVTIDNYLDDCTQNEDIHKASWSGRENTLWYKVNLFNGWKCKNTQAGGWDGPNGLRCESGETTSKHTDGLQLNGPANNGGWFALIDSKIVNAGISLLRMGSVPDGQAFGPKPNLLVQGFEAAQKQSVGEATTYFDDCDARGTDSCRDNRIDMATDWDTVWLIDVYGNVHFDGFHGDTTKVIVVNTGCGTTGCNGTIEYNNRGWPHPISGQATNPDQVCPNGIYEASTAASDGTVGATFCYTSLENALNDVATGANANLGDCPAAYCPHERPPFIHLSDAGWETPPGGGGSNLHTTLSVTPNPVEAGSAHTLDANPSGGTGPYETTWDCDGDGACDDGTPDTDDPAQQVCTAISTPGSYQVKACVEDAVAATTSAEVTLTVDPNCGNNVQEGAEVCDGSDLNSQTCVSQGFSGGTLSCHASCGSFVTTSCTGGPTCGDATCSPAESEASCFADCADFDAVLLAETDDGGWDYLLDPLVSGQRVDYGTLVESHITVIAEPPPGSTIGGFRFIMDGDSGSPYSLRQNSPAYAMCGDAGETLPLIYPCDGQTRGSIVSPPPLPKGEHTLVITPCSGDWAATAGLPDSACTGGGGTLGPAKTITFELVHKQVALGQPGRPYLIVKEE